MNKLITTADGGMPFNLDDLRWIFGQSASDAGIYQVLNKMLLPLGTDFIVTGCLSGIIGVGSVSEGLIMLDSELIWVDAHTATSTNFVKVESFDGNGLKTYRDESTADTYKKIRATVSSSSGGFALVGANRMDTATTSFKTIVELATNAETITGTDIERAVTPASLQSKVASSTNKGIVELATDAETITGVNSTDATTPASISARNPLVTKVIDIGDWDMVSNILKSVAHGLTLSTIRTVNITIRNDDDDFFYPFPTSGTVEAGESDATIESASATDIQLSRVTGGKYDSVDFDATSYNRGWIVIQYTQ